MASTLLTSCTTLPWEDTKNRKVDMGPRRAPRENPGVGSTPQPQQPKTSIPPGALPPGTVMPMPSSGTSISPGLYSKSAPGTSYGGSSRNAPPMPFPPAGMGGNGMPPRGMQAPVNPFGAAPTPSPFAPAPAPIPAFIGEESSSPATAADFSGDNEDYKAIRGDGGFPIPVLKPGQHESSPHASAAPQPSPFDTAPQAIAPAPMQQRNVVPSDGVARQSIDALPWAPHEIQRLEPVAPVEGKPTSIVPKIPSTPSNRVAPPMLTPPGSFKPAPMPGTGSAMPSALPPKPTSNVAPAMPPFAGETPAALPEEAPRQESRPSLFSKIGGLFGRKEPQEIPPPSAQDMPLSNSNGKFPALNSVPQRPSVVDKNAFESMQKDLERERIDAQQNRDSMFPGEGAGSTPPAPENTNLFNGQKRNVAPADEHLDKVAPAPASEKPAAATPSTDTSKGAPAYKGLNAYTAPAAKAPAPAWQPPEERSPAVTPPPAAMQPSAPKAPVLTPPSAAAPSKAPAPDANSGQGGYTPPPPYIVPPRERAASSQLPDSRYSGRSGTDNRPRFGSGDSGNQ